MWDKASGWVLANVGKNAKKPSYLQLQLVEPADHVHRYVDEVVNTSLFM